MKKTTESKADQEEGTGSGHLQRGVMPDVIEVKISIDDFPDNFDMTPSVWEMWVVGKLKSAGVPIKGVLTFRGLEKGTIERYDDPKDFGASTYRWKA